MFTTLPHMSYDQLCSRHVFYPSDCIIQLYEDGHVVSGTLAQAVGGYIQNRLRAAQTVDEKRSTLLLIQAQCRQVTSGEYVPIGKDDAAVDMLARLTQAALENIETQ